jgi:hypothetical protein
MRKIILLMILTSGMLVVSCQSNTYEEIAPVVEKPSYVKNFEPLLRSTCTGCHKLGAVNEVEPYLDTYELAKEATEKGKLICRIEAGDDCGGSVAVMPPSGKLPQTTIDVIKLWKAQGYLKE